MHVPLRVLAIALAAAAFVRHLQMPHPHARTVSATVPRALPPVAWEAIPEAPRVVPPVYAPDQDSDTTVQPASEDCDVIVDVQEGQTHGRMPQQTPEPVRAAAVQSSGARDLS
jgi:hypothetical protein